MSLQLPKCQSDLIPKTKEPLHGIRYRIVPDILIAIGLSVQIINITGTTSVDSRLTRIGLSGTTPRKGSADCFPWNVQEDRILLNPSYCIGHVQPTFSPARLQLDCSKNVDDEAVEQRINEDSKMESCEVLSDDDIMSRVTCGTEKTRNFEECPESDEENLVKRQKN
ncbi:hypothetical protein AVEN_270134-1 [Araneus ventricosus]|uniref:Uncharacterized protein n=1 Tax=Araneus ventricosus TaxID=182803 RepID=A0A4Y2SMD5_ARAVE|nr:hypothetical protein AVEN_270134-1 [Araneus ventricosus]